MPENDIVIDRTSIKKKRETSYRNRFTFYHDSVGSRVASWPRGKFLRVKLFRKFLNESI